jgi:adenylate cyclase
VTNALVTPPADRKAELLRWLTAEGRFAPDTGCLLEMLCEKLTELGTPIARATAHVRTLHPEFRGVSRIWRRGQSTEIRTSRHGIESTSDYQNSPVEHVIETGQWLDTFLSEATDRRFPILATLRAEGITHYVMAPLIFSNRIVTPVSWASDAPGGFTEADVELFRDLVPAFAPVLEVTAGRRIYGELLATYVGRDPCAQIMAGAIERGNVHHIKAAMLLADLRGFSRLTDQLPEERIIELLNAFFDLVVPSVTGSGGDVLKYIGDAVIAIFPVAGNDPARACASALAAARTTLAALQALPPEIQRHICIDIALHYGDAAYGNIGSGDRLDFTAVGRDINILSRLELLCKDVERPLLMTDAFAVEVAAPVFEIGHFELRGFRQHQSVYGLCQDGQVPSAPKQPISYLVDRAMSTNDAVAGNSGRRSL